MNIGQSDSDNYYPVISEKTDNSFSFRFIKKFDVGDIARIISLFDDEWNIDTSRNSNPNGAQRETQAYWLINCVKMQPFSTYQISENKELMNEAFKIINEIEEISDGITARAILAKLDPGAKVFPHVDRGFIFSMCRRFHVAVTTNESCYMTVNDSSVQIKNGECWEINNLATHSAINSGESSRIHLIFDVMPKDFLVNKKN